MTMLRLFKIEYIKLKSYRAFWLILAGYFFMFILVVNTIGSFQINGQELDTDNFFSFPGVWHNITYTASFLNFLLGILIILLITNEFNFRTFRQNVVDGLSRGQLIISKVLVMLIIALICKIIVSSYITMKGLADNQFLSITDVVELLHYPALLFLQAVGYMSIAAFIAYLIRKPAGSIVIFLAYTMFVERIIRFRLPDDMGHYLPIRAMNDLIPFPAEESVQNMTGIEMETLPVASALAFTGIYILFFNLASYLVIKRSNL